MRSTVCLLLGADDAERADSTGPTYGFVGGEVEVLHQVHPYESSCASGSRHAVSFMRFMTVNAKVCESVYMINYICIYVERESTGGGGEGSCMNTIQAPVRPSPAKQ